MPAPLSPAPRWRSRHGRGHPRRPVPPIRSRAQRRRPSQLAALALLMLVLLPAATASAAPARAQLVRATVERQVLSNGLTVLVEERPDASAIGVTLMVRAGARDDPPEREGAVGVLALTLLGGTIARPSRDLLIAPIESAGGAVNVNSSVDLTSYTMLTPAGTLAEALTVLGDMLVNPRFGVSDVAEAFDALAPAGALSLNTPLLAALWPDHPAGRPRSGTSKSRDAITYADLLTVRASYFGGRNMALAIVGPVVAPEVFLLGEQVLSAVPPGERRPLPLFVAGAPRTAQRVFPTRAALATIMMAYPNDGRGSTDAAALTMLSLLLSGPNGRLFQDVRGRHALARDVDVASITFADAGAIIAVARVQPANIDAALARFTEVFARLRQELLTEAELDRERGRIPGLLLLGQERVERRAAVLAQVELLGEAAGGESLAASLQAVTPEQLREAARRYLAPERAIIHITTPEPRP